jgi:hypothetical protein
MRSKGALSVLCAVWACSIAGCSSPPVEPAPKMTLIKKEDIGDFANAQEPGFQALMSKAKRNSTSDRKTAYLLAQAHTERDLGPSCKQLRLLDVYPTAGAEEGAQTWVFDACGTVKSIEISAPFAIPDDWLKKKG